ncbi:cell division protein ZapA [Natronospirillum operosum]|uniref:Cell division protein ZapA n=1 Tax=Natronospirillum operosum TaxID=2759953 RepID=A0A4Z0WE54_9GAMM|nr:cell division protein ZapA [Natronospirillum operosum]TGG93211.1 cell division protein ZapA [Natronospirillum operosum]
MRHQHTVQVRILDRDYTVACPPEAEDGLRAAARHLHDKMTEIRHSGKVLGVERVAVMAALNLIHELRQELQAQQLPEATLDRLLSKLDNALET